MSRQELLFSDPNQLVVEVLLDNSPGLCYSYLAGDLSLQVGSRVMVPVREREQAGCVVELRREAASGLRAVLRLIDDKPSVVAEVLQLCKWASSYYGVRLGDMLSCALPAPLRGTQSGEGYRQRLWLRLKREVDAQTRQLLSKRAPRQFEVLQLLEKEAEQQQGLELSALDKPLQGAARSLQKAGLVEFFEKNSLRNPDGDSVFAKTLPLALNQQQQQCLQGIVASLQEMESGGKPKPVLLYGVTGSGKTEVYLQAMQQALQQGLGVLFLVPEISLTPQTVSRVKSRFADNPSWVAVLHSSLSEGERHDEWQRIRSGEARIVIGARSAVFAPIAGLGLIIVDEEHDGAYKQDSNPRYHGRDLAVVRAHLGKAVVVLGSATPSLETWHNAHNGKYKMLSMTQRFEAQSLPVVVVQDMKAPGVVADGTLGMLGKRLLAALQLRKQRGEQSILFLNRRGFARALQCEQCGEVQTCPNCALALTYHRSEERLICHLCGHLAIVPRKCPKCYNPDLLYQGFGTQKVEEMLRRVLGPSFSLARIDADSVRAKHSLKNILEQFKRGQIDCLVGTQMIAKGLDFPNVTLVGILNADLGLHVPDFRAAERVFQLLTQVAGRAGRGDLAGEVIIQTFTPHAAAIQYARQHDVEGFFQQELEMRQMFGCPPFSHVIVVLARSAQEQVAQLALELFVKKLSALLPPEYSVTDALPAALTRSHNMFRFQTTLRGANVRFMVGCIRRVLEELKPGKELIFSVDVDAYNLV